MADGCAEMVFHYKGLFHPIAADDSVTPLYNYSLLQAQSKHFKRFVTQDSFGIFGAYLYPFAIPQLFRHASTDIINHMIDLKDLLGAEGNLLEERVMLATSNEQRAQLLTAFLEGQLQKNKRREPVIQTAVKQVIHAQSLMNIEQLSNHYNLSRRQFERKFTEYAGFTPKVYARIIRFQEALQQYGSNFKSLTDIAYECGYYDQSHFIHDFKEFSGYHPGQYFKGKPEGIEYKEV
jgi:AraC-like DNA-binding protein